MRTQKKLLVGLGVALVAAGCGDLTTPGGLEPAGTAVRADFKKAEVELKRVARALAAALEEPGVKLAVRDAMRDSPWDVHQLSLREHLNGAAGRTLLAAAAKAAGESPAAFRARVAALPDLDFYVPSREQRMGWTGGGSVVIAASLNPEGGEVFGFGAGGRSVSPEGAGSTVMLLHPAEPRGRRNAPQPLGVGDVIQTSRDGELAIRAVWVAPDGKETEMPVGDGTLRQDGPRFSSATVHGDSTYLDYLHIDFTDPGDDAEITVFAKFYAPDGSYLGEFRYDNYSVRWNTHYYPHFPLMRPVLPDSTPAKIVIRVREDDADSWGNPDDWFGPRDFTWADRANIRTVDNGGNDHVNIELDWTRRAAPVFTTLRVSDGWAYTGQQGQVVADRIDQHGFRMTGSFTVSSWSASGAASIYGSSGNVATFTGNYPGYGTITASYGGKTGSGTVTVENEPVQCVPQPPMLICPE